MIDTNCHILPNLDNGSVDLSMTIEMANQAKRQGITHILATPHHLHPEYDNKKQVVEDSITRIQEELDRRGMHLILFPGQEVRIHPDLIQAIEQNTILFTDLNQRYLLLSFPDDGIPAYTNALIFELLVRNIHPIITRPEKQAAFRQNLLLLEDLIDQGCYTQMSAESYMGKEGKTIEQFCHQLLDRDCIHSLASGACRPSGVGENCLNEAYKKLESEYSDSLVFDLKQNARAIVNGETLITNFQNNVKTKSVWTKWFSKRGK